MPIAYTYEADVHCRNCTFARFDVTHDLALDGVDDREGNPVGRIHEYDEWCDQSVGGDASLYCGDCGELLAEHYHDEYDEDEDGPSGYDCSCDSCVAADEWRPEVA